MSRVLLIKLQPNQDLYAGLELACQDAGFTGALILSGVGSLNDAWFQSFATSSAPHVNCIPGPGLEVSGVVGEILFDANGIGQSKLTAWVTRADGSVAGGPLVRGRNIVCITFEFMIMEWCATPSDCTALTERNGQ